MLLNLIKLKNFRNFKKNQFFFNPFLTIIIGKNSVGKTNLLESIFFGVNGHGFRERKESQLISFGEKTTEVEMKLKKNQDDLRLRIYLNLINNQIKKYFFVNNVGKNLTFYHKENISPVLFTPNEIELVTGGPELRRHYLNQFLSKIDLDYKNYLNNYKNALKRRNKLLVDKGKKIFQLKEEIKFWDSYLEKHSKFIIKKRAEYIDFLNKNCQINHYQLKINYLKNQFIPFYSGRYFEKEVVLGQTLTGPQKDDIKIFINEKEAHYFASRSEQRLALLWLKINEIKYIETIFKKKPLLLLDDIFSELDLSNKKLVLNLVKRYQTVMTTTEPIILDFIDFPHSIITLK